jgi:hypothetical protein
MMLGVVSDGDLDPKTMRGLQKAQGQLIVLNTILHDDFFNQLIEDEEENEEDDTALRLSHTG